MEFEEALRKLKDGFLITNKEWSGKDMHLEVMDPQFCNSMDLPFIFIKNVYGEWVPWTPSQQDLFSNEWEVIES